MFDLLKTRWNHGRPALRDLRNAQVRETFRGLPVLDGAGCSKCQACTGVCPAAAIQTEPLQLDLGRCVFCGDCQEACPSGVIRFTHQHRLAAFTRKALLIGPAAPPPEVPGEIEEKAASFRRLFGRSLKLRQVSAGGCNGCELELNACGNVDFDLGRLGIEFVASPRHADAVVITGPVTENMAAALEDTYQAVPPRRLVILAGSCAISGGVFAGSPALDRRFLHRIEPDLYLPGCPAHPLTVIHGLLMLTGRL